jgi:hypothetical protein
VANRKPQEDVSLLDVLVDGFEKNEVLDGFHWRELPMPNEMAAARKFAILAEEARRWKGPPLRYEEESERRLATWSDLEIRQAGRGIMVRAKAPSFNHWWHESTTWAGDPMGPIFQWIEQETSEKHGASG